MASSAPISQAEAAVANLRRLALFLSGVAYQRFGNGLLEEQELLAALADVMMELYKLESVLLRTQKTAARGDSARAQLQQDLLTLQLDDSLRIAEAAARTILPHVSAGDEMQQQASVVRRLLTSEPVDLVAVGRRVGQAVYDARAYPL